MSIYLSHTSLRTAWGLIGHKGLTDATVCDVRRPEDAARTLREIKERGYFDNGFLSHIQEPIDLLVPSKKARIRSKRINPHLCLRDLPKGSFRRIRQDVFLPIPQISFLQMGEILSVAQLAAYGMELCGCYAIAPGTARGFIDRAPLVTRNELEMSTCTGPRIRGVGKARIALIWVCEGSRSPRETILVLVLCMPDDRGGYALPMPELNRSVWLSSSATRIAGVPVLHPDLCWYEARTIVEYDSDGTHLDEGQVIRDVNRKDAFAKDGWHVVTVTKERLNMPEQIDRIVRDDLAPRLSATAPNLTSDFVAARKALRGELFGFDPYKPSRTTNRGFLRPC